MEDYPRTLAEFEARFRSSRRAGIIGSNSAGRKDSAARAAVPAKLGPWLRFCGRVPLATGKLRSRRERSSRIPTLRSGLGSGPCGGDGSEERRQRSGAAAGLGLGSYQRAWARLHKLRRAMVRPGRDRMAGVLEVDETYLGGLEVGKRVERRRRRP